MKSRVAIFSTLLAAGCACAAPAIIVPSINSVTDENPFSGQGFTFVTNNSGMTPAVNSHGNG